MSLRRKILYFDNPVAGKDAGLREQALIVEALLKENDALTIWRSRHGNDFKDLSDTSLENFDLIATNGGDGTLSLVVEGIEKYRKDNPKIVVPPLIYIPTGSTNDFARSLGLSMDPIMAIQDSFTGVNKNFDIGKIEGEVEDGEDDRPFVYVAAFGAFVEASYGTSRELKNVLGQLAYFIEGIRLMPSIEPLHVKIKTNDLMIEDEFIFGALINSHSVGGIIEFRDGMVNLSDGFFELVLIRRPKHQIQYAELARQMLAQNFDHELLVFEHASEATFEFDEPVAFTLDGEFGGEAKIWKLSVEKERLRLRVPPQVF